MLEGPEGMVPFPEEPGVGGFDASIGWPARSVTWAKSVPGVEIDPPEILEKYSHKDLSLSNEVATHLESEAQVLRHSFRLSPLALLLRPLLLIVIVTPP